MYTRELIKETWKKNGLYKSKKSKVRAFLQYMEKFPQHCWDECEATFRKSYYDVFNEIVPPLLRTGDKLLRLNLIRRMQVKNRRELNLLKSFVKEADFQKDEIAIMEVAKLGHKGITAEIRQHPKITAKVRQLVQPAPSVPNAKVLPEAKPSAAAEAKKSVPAEAKKPAAAKAGKPVSSKTKKARTVRKRQTGQKNKVVEKK